jgi:hypothetical protein
VSVPITNIARTLARHCRPLATSVARRDQSGRWDITKNWVALPLYWTLGEIDNDAAGRPTEERHLVPQRQYLFDLVCFRFVLFTTVALSSRMRRRRRRQPVAHRTRANSGTLIFYHMKHLPLFLLSPLCTPLQVIPRISKRAGSSLKPAAPVATAPTARAVSLLHYR